MTLETNLLLYHLAKNRMKRKEILDLNFVADRELGNGHQLYRHELFTLLFIEKDGELEIDKDDASRLNIVKQFEEHERKHLEKPHPSLFSSSKMK